MDEPYAPRPDSKGDIALQHLRCHGRTPAIDLADVMDCPVNNVKNNIALCLQHGLIVKVKTPEGVSYDIGDGTAPAAEEPDAPPADASIEAAQIEGKVVKADHAEKRSAPRKVKAPRTVGAKPKKSRRPVPAPSRQAPQTLPATAPPPTPQRSDRVPGTFAFVSDGSLEIYGVGGAVTVLTTAKLRAMAELFGSA